MGKDLVFLGWDEPLTVKVSSFLLPQEIREPVDLSGTLVVVPTRQAGRRLKEALARRCAAKDVGLIPPAVATPSYFLSIDWPDRRVATPTLVWAAWASVLQGIEVSSLPGLFPAGVPDPSAYDWALQTGHLLQALRERLVDGGYLIRDIVHRFAGDLPEPERWLDLSRLEQRYLDRLEALGWTDPCVAITHAARSPQVAEGVTAIVLAAVPDPTLPMLHAVEKLSGTLPVQVLVHAPPGMSEAFDSWGRPLADVWGREMIHIDEPDQNIFLAGSPVSQARKVLDLFKEEAKRFGAEDAAVGVPDSAVTSFLIAELREHDLHAFDPAGKPLIGHPVCQLLTAFRDLMAEETFEAFAALVRHADVLDILQRTRGLTPAVLLEELDRFQNDFLPAGWPDLERLVHGSDEKGDSLKESVRFIAALLRQFEASSLLDGVGSLLTTVYEGRMLHPTRPADLEFRTVARDVMDALQELTEETTKQLGTGLEDSMHLLIRRLETETYYPDKPDAAVDLEGWLELPWNDAPFLIVTGMNDGAVPDSRLSDAFLPDALLVRLGLRHDAERLARDAYLMRSLLESRSGSGRVCFISGKTRAAGDPMKPSRLLFRCADDELPARANNLFGKPDEVDKSYPASISFRLNPAAGWGEDRLPGSPPVSAGLDVMHVTMFRSYLACPFRFYLRHILGMEELNDSKGEMDALDFGTMLHRALQLMAEDDNRAHTTNADDLGAFLWDAALTWATRRYGGNPPLHLHIQLESARQRLQAAAHEQVRQVEAGWELVASEVKVETRVGEMMVRGKIDRIDRHRDSGAVRLLDYKSSDTAVDPAKGHLGSPMEPVDFASVEVKGRQRRWTDLQLPLYRQLLAERPEYSGPIQLGYFNLPKAVSETGVTVWEDFDGSLQSSAAGCAEAIVAAISARAFWPPAERVQFDEFDSLFHGRPEESFRADALLDWAKGESPQKGAG